MRVTIALVALSTAWVPSPASAQPPSETTATPIALRPAAAPIPALKYRLVPERTELVPGNAALFYHRSLQMVSDRRTLLDEERKEKGSPTSHPESTDDLVNGWVAGPIGEIPVDRARELLARFASPLKEAELGAMRSACDWEFDRRDEGISLLLPEIQEMRGLARLVSLRARLAILEGKADEAMHWVEVGLEMGRHVGRGPIMIQALVGIAIDSMMVKCLEELIQVPGMPSLYWALADRPRPFVDMKEALDGERNLLEREVPGLLELSRGIWGIDQARRFADELQRKLYSFENGRAEGSLAQRFGVAAMTAKIYPVARRALVARGRPEAEVEAMPVVQVASLYCYQEYRRLLDESYKWMAIPLWQSVGRDGREVFGESEKRANPLLAMFHSLMAPLGAARLAALRLDRQLDALQCVEAIRLDAARTGKMPASLESIAEAPAPLDPATNRPFDYKVDGDSATLSASLFWGAPNHSSYTIRYALKMAR